MGILNLWRRPKTCRPHILLQQLEERIVLDAAVNPVTQDNPATDTSPVPDGIAKAAPSPDTAPAASDGLEPAPLPTTFDHIFNQELNVVLISNSVGDVQGVSAAAKDNAQVIVFDSSQEGLASIEAKLTSLVNETGTKIDVLAVVTHGSDGTIEIGQDHVTESNFWAYKVYFEALAADLKADAQLQFYSCDTAESGVGESLVTLIALATGADVFASNDATGGPGNDWTLEYSTDSAVHMTVIFDQQALGGLTLELGGQPGEPRDAWFHGTGLFQGWDIYNYNLGVYYTQDYKTYWNHLDSGAWKYYNTAAWVTTDNLGDAPYGDGNHYAAVNSWFTVPSGVGSYTGHQAYIAAGVEYYQDDIGATPHQYWVHYDSNGSWSHWDGSTWRTVTGFEAYPQNVWFHLGSGGFEAFDYAGGMYYTKDYKTYWDHQDSGAWRYYNTAAWVTTDNLGNAPYGDGNHYAPLDTWFTVPAGVGSYTGHQAYIAAGAEYYQDDTGATPPQYWVHYDSNGSWSHSDGSVWRTVTGFEAYPQNVWFHLGSGGFEAYDYAGGMYYTKDHRTYWDHQDSGGWRYYNTVSWVTTDNLGDAPYGDGNHYAPLDTWFVVPDGVGSYSGHPAYITAGAEYYQEDSVTPHYWAYYYSTGSWQFYDGVSWNSVPGFGDTSTFDVNERIEYWVLYYMNWYRAHPVAGPWGVPSVQPALVFNAAVDWMAEKHLQDILNTHVWAHNSTAFPSGWQTLEQRGGQIGWAGWQTGQIGENLYIQFYDLNGNYQLDQGTSEVGSYSWSAWTDARAQQFAEDVVYAFVVDDASSNWGHRTPITNEQGWNLCYAGVAADRGVVAVNFSTLPY